MVNIVNLLAIILLIAVCIIAVGIIIACCMDSGECSRQEEKEHPCDTCLRWSECNGVDEECPRRTDHV